MYCDKNISSIAVRNTKFIKWCIYGKSRHDHLATAAFSITIVSLTVVYKSQGRLTQSQHTHLAAMVKIEKKNSSTTTTLITTTTASIIETTSTYKMSYHLPTKQHIGENIIMRIILTFNYTWFGDTAHRLNDLHFNGSIVW